MGHGWLIRMGIGWLFCFLCVAVVPKTYKFMDYVTMLRKKMTFNQTKEGGEKKKERAKLG